MKNPANPYTLAAGTLREHIARIDREQENNRSVLRELDRLAGVATQPADAPKAAGTAPAGPRLALVMKPAPAEPPVSPKGLLNSTQLGKALSRSIAVISNFRSKGMPHTKVEGVYMHDLTQCREWFARHRGTPRTRRSSHTAGDTDDQEDDEAGTGADVEAIAEADTTIGDDAGSEDDPAEPAPPAAPPPKRRAAADDDPGVFPPDETESELGVAEPPADMTQRRVLRMFERVGRSLTLVEVREELDLREVPLNEVRALESRGFLQAGDREGRRVLRISARGRHAAEATRKEVTP